MKEIITDPQCTFKPKLVTKNMNQGPNQTFLQENVFERMAFDVEDKKER